MKVAICDDSEQDIADLKERLGKIIVGYTYGKIADQKPVTAHDLHAEGAMCALLKDALKTEPGTDTGAYTCNRAWRTICQYRARMQLTDGDQNGNEACRLCDHRSRIRRRLRGREIPGYQMPYGRPASKCSCYRSYCTCPEIQRRRGKS